MSKAVSTTATDVPYPWRWIALTALLLAEAMNLIDATIVQVAGPTIHSDLGGAVSDIQWFTTAYTLPFAVLLITGGRLGDIIGRRTIFTLGVAIFMLASLACAVSPSVAVLVGCRIAQGGAAAMIIPQTIGLIKTMFTGPEVPKALGSIGPVMGLAAVLGPVLGGVITQANVLGTSWRAVFLVNIPLSIAVLLTVPKIMDSRAPSRPRLDLTGTILVIVGIALVVFPLVDAATGGVSAPGCATIAGGLVVMFMFAVQQRRATLAKGSALLEISLLRKPEFSFALLTSTLFFAVTTGLSLVVVLEMQLGQRVDVLMAGLTLVPWSAGLAIGSWLAGAYLVTRIGDRVMHLGLATVFAGLIGSALAYANATTGRYPSWLLIPLGVVGLGVGLFSPSFFTSALHRVAPQEIGSAAGLLNAVQQLGATLGVAVLGSIYISSSADSAVNALDAVQITFWIAVVLILVCAVTVVPMFVQFQRSTNSRRASP